MSPHSPTQPERAPRHAGAAERKRQILDAAVESFAERGFYRTRVSDIARRAGVADGTIYLYFRSKDDILFEVFEVRMEEILSELSAAVATRAGPVEKLRVFAELYVSLVERDEALAEVLTIELRQSEKFIREYDNRGFQMLLDLLASIVREGQKAGEIRDGISPRLAARALFGALDEISLWGVLKQGRFDPARAAREVSTLMLEGLAAS